MVSHGKWIAGLTLGVLGGCFASYGYNDFDGKGTGGTGGAGGGGDTVSSSTGVNGGSGGTGVNCAVTVCGETINSACIPNGPCMSLEWAHRFGLGATEQGARNVALDKAGNVVIAGNYTDTGFNFGPDNTSPGVLTAAQGATQGYVARLDRFGNTEIATQFVGERIQDVAVDGNDDIVIAGIDVMQSALMLKKVHVELPDGGMPDGGVKSISVATTTESIAGLNVDPSVSSIAIDSQNNIYVLGNNFAASDDTVNCGNQSGVALNRGMFVIKFDQKLGCQWIRSFGAAMATDFTPIAITAKSAVASGGGVWITGLFNGTLDAGDLSYVADASRDMFLIQLEPVNMINNLYGQTIKSFRYGNLTDTSDGGIITDGTLTPSAIDADTAGRVYMAGLVHGKTSFHEELFESKQQGAFVAMVDTNYATTSTVFPCTVNEPQHVARASGIAVVGDKLFVTGTFAGTMNLRLDPPPIAVSSNKSGAPATSPFLAILSAPQLGLLSFDAYDGGGAAFDSGTTFLAASTSAVVLAGGWIKSLDFSTAPGGKGMLSEFSMAPSTNHDIFVAKFTP